MYIYIFLIAGYYTGQWYFRISAYVSIRYIKYASVAGWKGNYTFYPHAIISHAGRHRREVKVDTVNDKESTRITTRALAAIG